MKYFRFEEEHPFSLIVPLIEEGKLNPWEVDIVELANLYIEELRKREISDLRVPARAIVAAVFLLKKKLEVLFPKPPRKPRERKYTLKEIVEMFEQEYEDVKQEIKKNLNGIRRRVKRTKKEVKKREKKREIPLHVSKFEDVLLEVWESLKKYDVGKRIKFIAFFDKKDFVPQVMALLYLDFENKIRIYQEKPFDEIELEILET